MRSRAFCLKDLLAVLIHGNRKDDQREGGKERLKDGGGKEREGEGRGRGEE